MVATSLITEPAVLLGSGAGSEAATTLSRRQASLNCRLVVDLIYSHSSIGPTVTEEIAAAGFLNYSSGQERSSERLS